MHGKNLNVEPRETWILFVEVSLFSSLCLCQSATSSSLPAPMAGIIGQSLNSNNLLMTNKYLKQKLCWREDGRRGELYRYHRNCSRLIVCFLIFCMILWLYFLTIKKYVCDLFTLPFKYGKIIQCDTHWSWKLKSELNIHWLLSFKSRLSPSLFQIFLFCCSLIIYSRWHIGSNYRVN